MIICRKGFDLKEYQGKVDPESILTNLGISIHHTDGDEIVCHCPFKENHKNGDRNPSFNFNTTNLIFQCWTCGGGNLVSLIKSLRPDLEVEKWLDEQASPIQQRTISLKDKINTKRVKVEEEIMSYPDTILTSYHHFHPYLRERGISKDVARKMRIGYDEAHNGVTIPHFFNDKLRGWQTRHLSQIDGKYVCNTCNNAKPIPKYTNTTHFPKKNTLYNYSYALERIKETGEKLIVVESPFTVLKLMTEGYEASVATFGAWSKEQMFSLVGCLQGVLLWPDNDPAGRKNVGRVMNYLSEFVPVRIVPVVDKEKGDAADLSKEEIQLYLLNSYSPFLLRNRQQLLTLKEVQNGF